MSLAERPLLYVGLDPEALRRLLTRKPVILPASTGELVKLDVSARSTSNGWPSSPPGRCARCTTRFKARPFLGGEIMESRPPLTCPSSWKVPRRFSKQSPCGDGVSLSEGIFWRQCRQEATCISSNG